jgi:transcriptional regulator with XRE-family HTH domain
MRQPPKTPSSARALAALGERLRLARLRRDYSAETVATRAGISRVTLYRAERGLPSIAIGTLLGILQVLGLDRDLDTIAADDRIGRRLQDLGLPDRRRASKRAAAPPDGAAGPAGSGD